MEDEQAQTAEIPANEEPTQAAVAPTEQIPSAGEGPAIETGPASLHDVAATAGSYARGRLTRARDLLASHRLALAVILALALALILGIALAVRTFADMPDTTNLRQDAQGLLAAPAYNGGTFGSDDPLVLRDVEVTGRHKEMSNPNECQVTGIATFSNGSVECLQEAQVTYVHQDGAWKCVGAEATGGASYTATEGVQSDKVISNVSGVLQRAEASFSEEHNGTALPTLYAGAQVTVTDDAFDADGQTDVVTLHLARSAAFTAYECDVRATFTFRPSNGLWELTAATASDNAKDITLSPLVGTWTGAFREQTSTGDGKCFGAKASDLQIIVTSAAGGRITGTISGIAHYHGDVTTDVDASEGDRAFTTVPFTGTLLHEGDGIAFACTTPEDASGTLELSLQFGTQEDPSAARATLTTTHTYEASWLIFAYDRDATFSDTFVLTRN